VKISINVVKSGKAHVFSLEEEARLMNHLKEMARLGYGYTRREVVDIATDFACAGLYNLYLDITCWGLT
jgi:hypothetical protein